MTRRLLTAALIGLAACTSSTAPPGTVATVPAPAVPTTSPVPDLPTSTATSATIPSSTTSTASAPRSAPSTWPELVALGEPLGTFDAPVDLEQHPVSGMWYVVEQDGVVQRVGLDARHLDEPAIDLSNAVMSGGEQGLLGIAFGPSGETVFLSRPDGTVADQASFGAQQTDMGFARVPNGTGDFVIQTPTFQASNDLASEIDPATESLTWALHPNPANATLTLFAEHPVDISVSDLHGRLVRQGLLQPGQAIDTSGWPSGLYVVQAEGRRSLQVVQH